MLLLLLSGVACNTVERSGITFLECATLSPYALRSALVALQTVICCLSIGPGRPLAMQSADNVLSHPTLAVLPQHHHPNPCAGKGCTTHSKHGAAPQQGFRVLELKVLSPARAFAPHQSRIRISTVGSDRGACAHLYSAPSTVHVLPSLFYCGEGGGMASGGGGGGAESLSLSPTKRSKAHLARASRPHPTHHHVPLNGGWGGGRHSGADRNLPQPPGPCAVPGP